MIFLSVQTAKKHLDAAGSQGGLCRSLTDVSVAEGHCHLEGKRTFPGEHLSVATCRLSERLNNWILLRSAE